jgi:hypothetical protein
VSLIAVGNPVEPLTPDAACKSANFHDASFPSFLRPCPDDKRVRTSDLLQPEVGRTRVPAPNKPDARSTDRSCPSPKTCPFGNSGGFSDNSPSTCWPQFCVYFGLCDLLGSGHESLAIENLELRRQLAAYKRKRPRPLLTERDRLFWVGLSRLWNGWRDALVIVQPATVVRWQHERFRRFWARLSRPTGPRGRPAVATQIRRLVRQIATANPLWRAPRIHGELKMFGY